MNAKERKRLIDAIETYLPLEYREPILRALRLLAAAERNDGSTQETDDGAFYVDHFDGNFTEIEVTRSVIPRTLERERNGLAARVAELEKDAERYRWLRKGESDDVAVVRGLGAMDYGMSAVVYTYSEEIDGDDLDAAIDHARRIEGET